MYFTCPSRSFHIYIYIYIEVQLRAINLNRIVLHSLPQKNMEGERLAGKVHPYPHTRTDSTHNQSDTQSILWLTILLEYWIIWYFIIIIFTWFYKKIFLIINISIFKLIILLDCKSLFTKEQKQGLFLVVADALRPLAPPVAYTGTGCKQKCLWCKACIQLLQNRLCRRLAGKRQSGGGCSVSTVHCLSVLILVLPSMFPFIQRDICLHLVPV